VCKLDINDFDKCTSKYAYGYNNSAPCIFLKLNRIYGWKPDYYNDPDNLPEEMPQSLKDKIKSLPESNRNQIWVTCYGENGADKEILGDIEYFPTQGFPSYFYPYEMTKGYVSPLVAVKFTRPKGESPSPSFGLQEK
jgi:sodium/potassium-transporting ATPase subunit beta